MGTPLVSVILPVYNGGPYLAEAISGILSQSYGNFELIVIDDGSTDDSPTIIASFDDPRIRAYSQENRGLSPSLNRAIALSRGKYLARQDADDVSFPERLARQVAFLEAHPEHGVVGTWSEIWEGERRTGRAHRHYCDSLKLKFHFLLGCYFVHTSVMIRASLLQESGGYAAERARQPEDYDLWSRLLRGGRCRFGNIPEPLVAYREVASSICRTDLTLRDGVVRICRDNIAFASGREISDPVVCDLAALAQCAYDRVSPAPRMVAVSALVCDLYRWACAGEGDTQGMLKELLTVQARIWRAYLCWRVRPLAIKLGLAPADGGA